MPQQRKSDKSRSKSERPLSRESTQSSRASSRASTSAKGRESSVLTAGSLAILAREVGAEKVNGLVLCMYLNIPNTTIVNATNEASATGLLGASNPLVVETTQRLLLTWKELRAGSKDKDKVKDLERALKEMGKPEFADVVLDRHSNNLELTSDAFSNL